MHILSMIKRSINTGTQGMPKLTSKDSYDRAAQRASDRLIVSRETILARVWNSGGNLESVVLTNPDASMRPVYLLIKDAIKRRGNKDIIVAISSTSSRDMASIPFETDEKGVDAVSLYTKKIRHAAKDIKLIKEIVKEVLPEIEIEEPSKKRKRQSREVNFD